MKKAFTLIYAVAVLAAFLLLSCNTSHNTEPNDQPKKGDDLPPYNPNVVIIEPEVEKWMEEQLASGGSEKRLLLVSDMHLEPTDWDYVGNVSSSYNPETGEYIVNGQSMSEKEYEDFMEDYRKKYYEQHRGKRDLPIPGVISENSGSWTAHMTAQEILELTENYKELAIEDYREPVDD